MKCLLQGVTVVMACRSLKKAQEAMGEIQEELFSCRGSSSSSYPHAEAGRLLIMVVDLGDLLSVKSFCEEFKTRFDRLDALVLNAGLNVSNGGGGGRGGSSFSGLCGRSSG